MGSVRDLRVVVTGGSSGIGAALARDLAGRGARLVLVARDAARLERLASELTGSGASVIFRAADLGRPAEVERLAAELLAHENAPDVLVNCAGAGRWRYPEETSAEELVADMAVPYFAAFLLARAFLPGMRRRGSGRIVNVTSLAGHLAWPGATAYTAARWAMRGFTEALRADLAGSGVEVTLATFAKVASEYWSHNAGSEARVPPAQSMMRVLTPEEAARAIADGIERGREYVAEPAALRWVLLTNRLFPSATRRMMTRSRPALAA